MLPTMQQNSAFLVHFSLCQSSYEYFLCHWDVVVWKLHFMRMFISSGKARQIHSKKKIGYWYICVSKKVSCQILPDIKCSPLRCPPAKCARPVTPSSGCCPICPFPLLGNNSNQDECFSPSIRKIKPPIRYDCGAETFRPNDVDVCGLCNCQVKQNWFLVKKSVQ